MLAMEVVVFCSYTAKMALESYHYHNSNDDMIYCGFRDGMSLSEAYV